MVVYHVPKTKGAATELEGMEGVVDSRADDHEGTYISANLEVRVALPVPDDPKGKTLSPTCARTRSRRSEKQARSGAEGARLDDGMFRSDGSNGFGGVLAWRRPSRAAWGDCGC